MDDAWQSQDMGPASNGGGISIPTSDAPMSNGARDEQGWSNSRSPPRDQGDHPPRRSSRSRSPTRGGDDRGRGEAGTNPGNNLHVSGLSSRVDTRDLEQAFAKVGRVKKAQVMYDPHTRESRGFGFVTMETGEEADAAVTALNNTDFMGKTITVTKARRGRARTPTPGRYYGPPKRHETRPDERPYDPRPYDSRYSRGGPRGGGGGGYDDYGPPRARRAYDDDYRSRDYDRGHRDYDRGGYERGGGGGGYERRDYDRRY
ncbi:RNA-binding domain-containing protein [Phanerochaete sordida]|uniref:RNA-binding domain-containing protein n=1 Tax=Phanerochaete sordida TaxID=48140 RepID=A0A9P3LKT6_9APHY|nr:RNA-binding domain-containing protein [Phanerochaete sordida]